LLESRFCLAPACISSYVVLAGWGELQLPRPVVHRNSNIPVQSSGSISLNFQTSSSLTWGYTVAQLLEALHYKSEGRGFDL
jgi:hypothetical protein